MKRAVILHGHKDTQEYYDTAAPNGSNGHWIPWLQNQLMINDIKADTPDIVKTYELDLKTWQDEVGRYDVAGADILVGHSMGGGYWVRYMSEHPDQTFDTVVLVAPWLNVNHEWDTPMFDFEIDPSIVKRAKRFIVFTSDDDHPEVQNSTNHLQKMLKGAHFKEFHSYGHFCFDAFPELLEAIIGRD